MKSNKPTYSKYLQLDKILDAQDRQSEILDKPIHDEMLFIVIHQIYELWFKQIIHEIDSIIYYFNNPRIDETNINTIVGRLNRIHDIQKIPSGTSVELKVKRDDVGLSKISFPSFKDIALRYMGEVSSTKKSFIKERYIINALMNESWAEYPIHKINPCVIGKYRDKHTKRISGSSVNRSLDAISTIFTTCKKEWGYPVSNPVTSIRRPKKAEPRNRRFTDHELDKLIKGNRASPKLRLIIQIALETAMRQGEILRIKPEHINGNTLFIPVTKTKPIKDFSPEFPIAIITIPTVAIIIEIQTLIEIFSLKNKNAKSAVKKGIAAKQSNVTAALVLVIE